jgi:hypothetical protein
MLVILMTIKHKFIKLNEQRIFFIFLLQTYKNKWLEKIFKMMFTLLWTTQFKLLETINNKCQNDFFLFDTVRIWGFSPVLTDFYKCHNLTKRNVNLILTILSDLEPLKGLLEKKTLYSTRSCVNWALFGIRGPLKTPRPLMPNKAQSTHELVK